MKIKHWGKLLLTKHWTLTFIIMLFSSFILGICSYNLFYLFKENINLVINYGYMALMDGALKEIAMLCLNGIISLSAYVIFKACEKQLVDSLLGKKP